MFDKQYWKDILMRAWHAVWETAAATLPATIVITPAMIEHFDTSYLIIALAWVLTALFAGFASIVKSLAAGVPETNYRQALEQLEELRPFPEVDEEDEDGSADETDEN